MTVALHDSANSCVGTWWFLGVGLIAYERTSCYCKPASASVQLRASNLVAALTKAVVAVSTGRVFDN
jgi:hypothetical protein